MLLLAIDIGNTNIHNGVFKGKALKKSFRIPTYSKDLTLEYSKKLRHYLEDIDKVIVVSVVPPVLKKVEYIFREVFHKEILIVGRDVDNGVKNLYKKPNEVGQDRLVNARAAHELYGEAIVVDFGTAITIDIVNKKKEYLGGVIVPGVEISVNALSEKASLLPKIKLRKPKSLLGRETEESMISGAVYGFSKLCDGIVQEFKSKYCKNATIIATGGLSNLIGPYCTTVDKIDPELTLKGLWLIEASEKNNGIIKL